MQIQDHRLTLHYCRHASRDWACRHMYCRHASAAWAYRIPASTGIIFRRFAHIWTGRLLNQVHTTDRSHPSTHQCVHNNNRPTYMVLSNAIDWHVDRLIIQQTQIHRYHSLQQIHTWLERSFTADNAWLVCKGL